MTKNNGSEAQDAFVTLKERQKNTVVERFYDQSDLRGLNKGRAVGDFPKPSDFLVTEEGAIHYAEVKSTQNPRRFPFGQIERGQRAAALKQAAVGGPYNFYIFTYGLSQWFIMTANQFAAAVAAGKASLPFEELTPWNP